MESRCVDRPGLLPGCKLGDSFSFAEEIADSQTRKRIKFCQGAQHDQVGIIATDEQIKIFKPIFDSTEQVSEDSVSIDAIGLEKIVVDEYTLLKGKDIRSSGLREKVNGLVIGIERNNQRILNPDSTTVFEWDDIVWLVGETEKIRLFRENKLK